MAERAAALATGHAHAAVLARPRAGAVGARGARVARVAMARAVNALTVAKAIAITAAQRAVGAGKAIEAFAAAGRRVERQQVGG